jgi:DNA-binding response OmpR family regulator
MLKIVFPLARRANRPTLHRSPPMPDAHPVLVADDDAAFCDLLAAPLRAAGFRPIVAGTAAAAEAMLTDAGARYEALLLDVGLPDGDGHALCAALRQRGVTLPILMLTGAAEEQDVVRGFAAGASDYIAKPFRAAELVARLQARIRAFANTDDALLVIGPYDFRPAARTLLRRRDQRHLRLTEKEAAILKFLHRVAPRQVARQELLGAVWGYSVLVTTHTLETHVYRLRQKIEADPGEPRLLLTVEGGYRLDPAAA